MNIDDVFKDEGSKEERVDEFQGQGATEEDTDTADDAAREGEEVSQDEE
ncbi:MAG: hypothetical protein GWN55_06180, partial [Phycisphaerae bacterium]|nr:hypothetical protein [candidate division KSB1 bacterium]NIV00902.1 hypothetical protein [Phycisphaerae bacterium]NIS24778.1 hypothetical protein [candidate division KSB1 bacterium]NIT71686.1 hypothetical protein [candidate division KSB1 bacterium]NIU25412.1 hypothetical protein [candidate division KSB1 bacterium]